MLLLLLLLPQLHMQLVFPASAGAYSVEGLLPKQ